MDLLSTGLLSLDLPGLSLLWMALQSMVAQLISPRSINLPLEKPQMMRQQEYLVTNQRQGLMSAVEDWESVMELVTAS